ncbi:proteasome inhibitor PI31 subunit-like isoform X2 [Contarinia nasturtii]|uniref:proteasome inhibitor PI31 subunit-like isoform X2 n=1 Tax=Contarinia nasturtii TaxID=265458 RepID=UPI0012D476BD|nr:proteasome inhibitor PI31 subunit-like isoform X2 [Contarinia nasturtii]
MSAFWDLIEESIADSLNCKSDTLVAIAHNYLAIHAGFKCIGLGEELQALDDIEGQYKLPNNWNVNTTKYALRYVFDGFVYVLIATVPHGSQQIHFELQTANPANDSTSYTFEWPFDQVIQIRGQLQQIFANKRWTLFVTKLAVAIRVVKDAHPPKSPTYDPNSPSFSVSSDTSTLSS